MTKKTATLNLTIVKNLSLKTSFNTLVKSGIYDLRIFNR